MERFLIVTNDGKDKGQKVTGEVIRLLESRGKACIRCRKDENSEIMREAIPDGFDCAVVIGGCIGLIRTTLSPCGCQMTDACMRLLCCSTCLKLADCRRLSRRHFSYELSMILPESAEGISLNGRSMTLCGKSVICDILSPDASRSASCTMLSSPMP